MKTKFFRCCLIILPIIFLNIKHGVNLILFLLFIGAVFYLAKYDFKTLIKENLSKNNFPFLFVLVAPVLAIAITQFIRKDFYPNNWDAPLRMLLCMPIYMAISQGWLIKNDENNVTRIWIKWVFPLALVANLITVTYFPATNWGTYRTTYFVDPLTFCSYSLLFSFLAIIGLTYYYKEIGIWHKLLYIASIFIGFYLSATSGARTGWLNFPFFIIILQILIIKKHEKTQQVALTFILIITLLTSMVFSPQLTNKLYIGWQEFLNYKLHEINNDTSVGMRLSFYRMGIEYFFERPFAGWGDLSWMEIMNERDFLKFASSEALKAPRNGFHNEIITNSVRSGIWGLISVLSLYVLILNKALTGLRMQLEGQHRLISISMLVVIMHLILAGLFTETTNLTFLSAFIGILFSVLLGEQKFLEGSTAYVK